MAKHIQCVQAIQNCMKKVKAEYHNVPPLRPSVVPIPRNLLYFSCIVNIAIIIIMLIVFQIIILLYTNIIIKTIARTLLLGSKA